MALSDVELVNLAIGNTKANPYYPILTDEEVQAILDSVDGNIALASKRAATNASFVVISIPNREKIGDIEIWNEYSRNYIEALKNVINDQTYLLPNGMMPYAGGIENSDFIEAKRDPNRHAGGLVNVIDVTRRRGRFGGLR